LNLDQGDQRQEVAEQISNALSGWAIPQDAVALDGLRWLPDLVNSDGRLLYLALEEIDDPWKKRLRAAHASSHKLVVACPPSTLSLSNLELLQEIDASPILVNGVDDGVDLLQYESVADLIAKHELSLGNDGLQALAGPLFDRALECEDTYAKGLLFEQVLCLVLSQVSYFQVLEHRYVNETEEIDLVLGNRATGPLAEVFGGPLILVSGKNQKKPTGAPEVRDLRGNMGKRRGRCSFGIVAAARDLASTAAKEQSHTTDDPTKAIALLSGSMLRHLISSKRLDQELQVELMKAVLE
jgi:Restriction endonuclease